MRVKLPRIFGGGGKATAERLRVRLARFRELVQKNDRVLTLMAEAGEMLGGEYLFGRLRAGSLQRSHFHARIGTAGFHGYLEPSGAVTDLVFEVDEHDSDSGNRLHELLSSTLEWAGSVAIVPLQWLFEQKLSADGRDVCPDAKGGAPGYRQR